MDMNDNDDMIMPPSVALTFTYSNSPICSVPVFFLVRLARNEGVADQNQYLSALDLAPDEIVDGVAPVSAKSCLAFLQKTINWVMLAPYLSCPDYLREPMGALWSNQVSEQGPLSLHFERIPMPDVVYRYMKFRHDRASQLLEKGKLFMPCPAMFNDPFDCSLDEATRLTFIEAAIGCFSTVPDDVLMFSHYAENHRGIAVGFDTRRLIGSLTDRNSPLRADIRPVWYFPTMPRLDLQTQPALCATCKSDIWRYEKEFRIFMVREPALVSWNVFTFDRNAIVEVICGCKAPDETVAACKALTADLPNCRRKKALQIPNSFGVKLREIHRM